MLLKGLGMKNVCEDENANHGWADGGHDLPNDSGRPESGKGDNTY